jgi:hypothetical protein
MILRLRKQSGQPRSEPGLTNVMSLARRFANEAATKTKADDEAGKRPEVSEEWLSKE